MNTESANNKSGTPNEYCFRPPICLFPLPRHSFAASGTFGSGFTRPCPGECDETTNRTQHRNRVREIHENETIDSRIKGFSGSDVVHVAVEKTDIVKSGDCCACLGTRNRISVLFDANNLPGRTNKPGDQHRHVSHPRSKIEDPLAGADTCSTEKALGYGSNYGGLSNQAFLLRIRVAQCVIGSRLTGRSPILDVCHDHRVLVFSNGLLGKTMHYLLTT